MERWFVEGYRKIDFTDNSGKSVKGIKLFLSRSDQDGIEGKEVTSVWLTDRIDYQPEVGDFIIIMYNRYGKISGVNYDTSY